MSNSEDEKLNNVPTADAPRLDGDPFWQALQNSLIMGIIFSFFSITDLKNFRLVNRICSQVGTMTLFKKVTRLVLGSIQREQLKKLTDMIRTSSSFPCSKFCFRSRQTKNPEDATLEEFFHAVSPFITELGIEKRAGHTIFCQNPNVKNQYPNLKTLEITHKCLLNQNIDDWAKDVEFLANVIAQSNFLDTVAIKSFNYDAGFITKFLRVLDSPQGRKIKHLELRGIVESQQIELAISLGLSLNTLTLEFQNLPGVSPASISAFLLSQTNTLQELEIGSFPAQCSDNKISFPRMNALKVLKISCKFSTGIHRELSYISYPQQFPKLKQLTFNVHCRLFNLYRLNQPRCDTLTTLELPTDLKKDEIDFGKMIQDAAQVFPNIKKLRISAWKGCMKMLDTYMRNVEELTLTKGNQKDCLEALTGYMNFELAWIEKHLEDRGELVFQERHKEPQNFLHNIKVLKIEQELERDFDLVYYLGLRKLRSLHCLDLRRGEPSISPNKVKEQTLVKMREQFEVLILEADIIRGKQLKQWKRERSVNCLGGFFS